MKPVSFPGPILTGGTERSPIADQPPDSTTAGTAAPWQEVGREAKQYLPGMLCWPCCLCCSRCCPPVSGWRCR